MSDEDVVRLQEYLTAKGFFTGATDPYFGPLTLRGLVAFQKANGISPASGFFGPVTRAYVNSNAASPTDSVPASSSPAEAPAHSFGENLSYRMEGSEVTALQNYLASKGFLSATANGIFGPQTLKALEGFQSSVGISPASGFFGPVTRSFVNASQ
jgi:peptidoglycan hydrolase-like protein with peptidoglycan-binding domain